MPRVKKDAEKTEVKKSKKSTSVSAVGRRKRASARVTLFDNVIDTDNHITINGKEWNIYFSERLNQARKILKPLEVSNILGKYSTSVKVAGGGKSAQVDAVTLGIARAVLELDPVFKPGLRREGLLTRDPREKERKKPGLLRARKKPQFSKR